MMLQLRSVRSDLSVSNGTDSYSSEVLLLLNGSTQLIGVGSLLSSQDRLASLFGETLEEELLPSAAKRPAKADDEDEDEDEDKADDDDADEDDEEETEEEDEDEEEEDEDEEEEEDEFEDADSGFDDDDDDDEEEFDDDE